MTDQQARIKLAEAMGWELTATAPDGWIGEQPEEWWLFNGDYHSHLPFDPFTDANDDYAVLEWMRAKELNMNKSKYAFEFYGWLRSAENYQIGDYARAALKVIDEARNV